jgi:hypothetical protein
MTRKGVTRKSGVGRCRRTRIPRSISLALSAAAATHATATAAAHATAADGR